jgi:hypothetical protein
MIELYLKTNEVKKLDLIKIDMMLKICLIFGLLILQIVSLQKFLKNLESICLFLIKERY